MRKIEAYKTGYWIRGLKACAGLPLRALKCETFSHFCRIDPSSGGEGAYPRRQRSTRHAAIAQITPNSIGTFG